VGRILGLDYGRKRIGVAVSDPMEITAQPVTTWNGLTLDEAVEKTWALVEELSVDAVVIGFPLTLQGKTGIMAKKIQFFSDKLKSRIDIPVVLWDERLTSVQSKRLMHEMNMSPSLKKGRVDLIASMLILQNYLDHKKGSIARTQMEED
jgi:putative Holliday junction resolvase